MSRDMKSVLSDRILLRKKINEYFVTNIKLRYVTAVEMMEIDESNLETIYCSSINKHTCVVSKDNNNYLIFDEHHMEVLNALNVLYYLYGQPKFKKLFCDLILSRNNYFAKRLKATVLTIITEQQLLNGNMKNALKYAKELEKISLIVEEGKDVAFSLLMLKMRKVDDAQAFSLNFYVFHEMAHVKHKQNPSCFEKIEDVCSDVYALLIPLLKDVSVEEYKVYLNLQECACDIYALMKLIYYMDENTEKAEKNDLTYYMIESYMISITNIVVMDSVYQREDICLSEVYFGAYLRIILVINTLGIMLENDEYDNVLYQFQNIMRIVREQHENYKIDVDTMWVEMVSMYGKESDGVEFMSEEWYRCFDEALNIISAQK